jgi:hypothetical protein
MERAHASELGAIGLHDGQGGLEMIDAPMIKQARQTCRIGYHAKADGVHAGAEYHRSCTGRRHDDTPCRVDCRRRQSPRDRSHMEAGNARNLHETSEPATIESGPGALNHYRRKRQVRFGAACARGP